MTFSVFMYTMMLATCVALAGVLVVDAVSAVSRWFARRSAQPVVPASRVPTASGARKPRVPAATRS